MSRLQEKTVKLPPHKQKRITSFFKRENVIHSGKIDASLNSIYKRDNCNINVTNTSDQNLSTLNSPVQKDSGIDDCSPLSYDGGYLDVQTRNKEKVCVYPPCPVVGDNQQTATVSKMSSVSEHIEIQDIEDDEEIDLLPKGDDNGNIVSSVPSIHSGTTFQPPMSLTDLARVFSNPKTDAEQSCELPLTKDVTQVLSSENIAHSPQEIYKTHENNNIFSKILSMPSTSISSRSKCDEYQTENVDCEAIIESIDIDSNTKKVETPLSIPNIRIEEMDVDDATAMKSNSYSVSQNMTSASKEDKYCQNILNGVKSVNDKLNTNKMLNKLHSLFNNSKLECKVEKNGDLMSEVKNDDLLTEVKNTIVNFPEDEDDIMDEKNDSNALRPNIFDLLSQERSSSVTPTKLLNCSTSLNGDQTNLEQNSELAVSLSEYNPIKQSTSHTKRYFDNDFESATGESQFNFYNANEVNENKSPFSSQEFVYNDCYLGNRNFLARSNSDVSNVVDHCTGSDSNGNCEDRAEEETPTKYIFQQSNVTGENSPIKYSILNSDNVISPSAQNTPLKEVLFTTESNNQSSLTLPNSIGYQTEFAKFLQATTECKNSSNRLDKNHQVRKKKVSEKHKSRKRLRLSQNYDNNELRAKEKLYSKDQLSSGKSSKVKSYTVVTKYRSSGEVPSSVTVKNIPETVDDVSHINPTLLPITSAKTRVVSSRQQKKLYTQYRKLALLRRRIMKLIHVVFPDLVYPKYFKSTGFCVENLLDQIMCELNEANVKTGSFVGQALPDEQTCCEVKVVLCKSPLACIINLRKKIIRFLKAILPNLEVGRTFDTSSDLVEDLLKQVIHFNEKCPTIHNCKNAKCLKS